MRMDKLTSKFQLALADAQSLAVGKDHQFIEPVHVLAAMFQQDGGSVRPLLARVGVNDKALSDLLNKALSSSLKCKAKQVKCIYHNKPRELLMLLIS